MATSTYIFNQYYIDLLKKIKVIAKKHKDSSKTASKVIDSIRENYTTLDKTSDEYINFVKTEVNNDVWKSYLDLPEEDTDVWLKTHSEVLLFKNISLGDITKLLRDNFLCHHFCSVFYIFINEISEEDTAKILKILQSFDKDLIESDITNEDYKKVLLRLNSIKTENIKNQTGINMGSLKDTTIGKIAKEIIEDVDVSKLQKSISEEGDIFKAIAKPDSGFSELFTNVSQKMATKISSGELSQENIVKDAMKLASFLPGMFNNNNKSKASQDSDDETPSNPFGDMADMNQMGNLMSMMSSMMGKGGMGDMLNQANKANGKKGTKCAFNDSQLKRNAIAKKLKSKLDKKKSM